MKLIPLYQKLIAVLTQLRAMLLSEKSMPQNPDMLFPWDTPEHCRHNIRAMCDNAGLPFMDKQIITACIYQESEFVPTAIGKPNENGTQDFGLCQYNNGKDENGVPYWIGPGAAFENTQEVLDNPKKNVLIMIDCYKQGEIGKWSSYSTGAYKQWLPHVDTPVPASGHYQL